MKYMGDSEWWNKRFKIRELNVMLNEKCLEEDVKFFHKCGKILDVACGDGRNWNYADVGGCRRFLKDLII